VSQKGRATGYLDKADNRFANLREATNAQNRYNASRQRNNKSGYKGVYFDKRRGKWQAQITKDGKTKTIGLYRSAALAHIVFMCHAVLKHGEYARFD
jgi:hypothetical protein